MRSVLNSWPATQLGENTKFAAQILREMLELKAFESFRVATLDAQSRLMELSVIAREVSKEQVPPITMDPCIEEVKTVLKNDEILFRNEKEFRSLFEYHTKKTPTKQEIAGFRSLLFKGYKDIGKKYRQLLEQEIGTEINSNLNQDRLKSLLNSHCSMLISMGYSRQFLRKMVVERFFRSDIERLHRNSLVRFLSQFDGVERAFEILIPISSSAAKYLQALDVGDIGVVAKSALPPAAMAVVSSRATVKNFCSMRLSAHDRYSAIRGAQGVLRALEAMARLSGRSLDFNVPNTGYTRQNRQAAWFKVTLDQVTLSKYVGFLDHGTAADIGSHTNSILKFFDRESVTRTFSSINMAAIATESERPEASLISLWSAVEVLLGDPPAGGPRVVHYVDSLVPCVCLTYFRRYCEAVLDGLKRAARSSINRVLLDPLIDQSYDDMSKFLQLVFDPACAPLLASFYGQLTQNPVAIFRMRKLSSNFGSRGEFQASMASYQQRVRWQLFRIYRARNSIVHGGRIPPNIVPLVLNVSEFFTIAASSIIGQAEKNGTKTNVLQAVREVGFEYELYSHAIGRGNPSDVFALNELKGFLK